MRWVIRLVDGHAAFVEDYDGYDSKEGARLASLMNYKASMRFYANRLNEIHGQLLTCQQRIKEIKELET